MSKYNQLSIVHHLLNNSPSKYMFSFCKTPRFFKTKQDEGVDKFYNLPSTLTIVNFESVAMIVFFTNSLVLVSFLAT